MSLTSRGEVVIEGSIVGSYELADGVLLMHDVPQDAAWLSTLGLRQVD